MLLLSSFFSLSILKYIIISNLGFGWPALSQIVTNKIDPKRAGTVWSILVSVRRSLKSTFIYMKFLDQSVLSSVIYF